MKKIYDEHILRIKYEEQFALRYNTKQYLLRLYDDIKNKLSNQIKLLRLGGEGDVWSGGLRGRVMIFLFTNE